MSPAARMKPILPVWQLVLLLAVSAAGIWFLLPDDPQLLEDLVRDGSYAEARDALAKLSAAKREQRAEYYRSLEVRLSRLEVRARDSKALAAFWLQAAAVWRETNFSGAVFLELTQVVPRLPDPAAAWSEISSDVIHAPVKQRERLATDFTRAALAANQPAAAAEIFAIGHPAARLPSDALELARLWQLAGRAGDALAALGDDRAPELTRRRIALLRALNRNREAFDLLRAEIASAPDQTPDATLAEEVATVGLAAGLTSDTAAILQRYVAKNPSDLAATRRLRDTWMAANQLGPAVAVARSATTLSKRQPADVRQLARVLEYSGQPAAAFDEWLELALAGDVPAVDRLVALNPGLYRDAELASALEKMVPVVNRSDLTLRLARVEVTLGRYEEARRHFTTYIASTADADTLLEFAHLHGELYRFTEAEAMLRRAAALRPDDLNIRREIAENLVLQNRPAQALAAYAQLAQQSAAEEILGPYIRLAESLGRYDDFTRGLRRRIDREGGSEARDYLLLAYGYELSNDSERRAAALEEGRRRAPQNDDLRLQLAYTFAGEKKYQTAQAALATSAALHTSATSAALYLDLMRLNNDTAAERRYLATPLSPEVAQDDAVLERVARSREALGEFAEAEKLWRALVALRPADIDHVASLARVLLKRGRPAEAGQLLAPFLANRSPSMLKLGGEIAEAAGDHRAAEKYQLAYLDAVRGAPSAEWGALGDIRLARGDRVGAKRAYAEALRRLQAQLAAKG